MRTTAQAEKLTIDANDLIGDIKILFNYTRNPCQASLGDLNFENILENLDIKISRKSGLLRFVPNQAIIEILQISIRMLLRSSLEDVVRGLNCDYLRTS